MGTPAKKYKPENAAVARVVHRCQINDTFTMCANLCGHLHIHRARVRRQKIRKSRVGVLIESLKTERGARKAQSLTRKVIEIGYLRLLASHQPTSLLFTLTMRPLCVRNDYCMTISFKKITIQSLSYTCLHLLNTLDFKI